MRGLALILGGLLLATGADAAAAQLPVPAPAPGAPSAEAVQAAQEALAAIDPDRVDRDPAYAAAIAGHLLVLERTPGVGEDSRRQLAALRVSALAAAGRHDEAEAAGDALIRARPGDAAGYAAALAAAVEAARDLRYATLMERAAQAVSDPAERAALLAPLEREHVDWHLHRLHDDRDTRFRLADALLRLGWPGPEDPPSHADWLRMIVLERHLERGDVRTAQRFAAEVRGVGSVLGLVTERRFDPLIGEADRVARVRSAIEEQDRATAAALAAAPGDVDALVERATFLRSIGRDRAVLDLLLPLMADPALIVGRGSRGLWLVNEAAYSLIATGAEGEAIELMRPLAAMDVSRQPDLINTSINFVHMLFMAGRHEDALSEAERLAPVAESVASDYGKMIVWGNAACSAAELGRRPESDRWVARMEPKADENPAAMIQARLCRGETEAAERVLVAALESARWREQVAPWTHDWEPGPETASSRRLAGRFAELRARPAVEAAFARVARRLRLPLPSTFYGF